MPGLRPGWDMFVLVCSVKRLLSDVLNGWPHDHGPTNAGAMVKKTDIRTFRLIERIGPEGRFFENIFALVIYELNTT